MLPGNPTLHGLALAVSQLGAVESQVQAGSDTVDSSSPASEDLESTEQNGASPVLKPPPPHRHRPFAETAHFDPAGLGRGGNAVGLDLVLPSLGIGITKGRRVCGLCLRVLEQLSTGGERATKAALPRVKRRPQAPLRYGQFGVKILGSLCFCFGISES